MKTTYCFSYKDGIFDVWKDTCHIGTVRTYQNPFHTRNCYLSIHIPVWHYKDSALSRQLFDFIQSEINRPLQVMADSASTGLIAFLLSGGFQCYRKCYERDFSAKNITFPLTTQIPLKTALAPSPDYRQCAELLYIQYQEKHATVNPLTASMSDFTNSIPNFVLYQKEGNSITQFAFVEENEVAYLGSTEKEGFLPFIQTVASKLLLQYGRIEFEADDCDAEAMALKGLFWDKDTSSFNTYIR